MSLFVLLIWTATLVYTKDNILNRDLQSIIQIYSKN